MTPVPPTLRRPVSGALALAVGAALLGSAVTACSPTVRLKVDPIQIYARLDADVRVKLDQELQDLLRENPNLF